MRIRDHQQAARYVLPSLPLFRLGNHQLIVRSATGVEDACYMRWRHDHVTQYSGVLDYGSMFVLEYRGFFTPNGRDDTLFLSNRNKRYMPRPDITGILYVCGFINRVALLLVCSEKLVNEG